MLSYTESRSYLTEIIESLRELTIDTSISQDEQDAVKQALNRVCEARMWLGVGYAIADGMYPWASEVKQNKGSKK